MSNEMNLEKQFPGIPQKVHNRVLDTLDGLEENKKNKVRSLPKRRILLVLVALVAVFGTMVAAAEIFRWNQTASKKFGEPAEELKNQLVMENVVKEQTESVSDQGITVSAVQTIKDEHRLYVLLKITSEEPVIDADGWFEQWGVKTTNENLFNNIGGGFSDDTASGSLTNEAYYEFDMLKDINEEWDEEDITLILGDYCYDTYENETKVSKKIEGNWNLTIPVGSITTGITKTYELNRDIVLSDTSVEICSVQISPISIILTYKADGIDALLAKHPSEDNYLDEIHLHGLLDVNGNEIVCRTEASNEYITENGEYVIEMGMNAAVDAKTVHAVLLGEKKVRVELK